MKGFKFVLLGLLSQIQMLLLDYCTKRLSKEHDTAEKFYILFYELFTLVPGKAYNIDMHSDDLKKLLLPILCEIGIVQVIDNYCYISPIYKKIFQSEKNVSKSSDYFLIVETNFKLYSYTSNPLFKKVLLYFSRIEYEFPNMIVTTMTQLTVKKAFSRGISAEDIIQFLLNHAHGVARNPDTNKMNSSYVEQHNSKKVLETVPNNILKQIRVWEKTYKAFTYCEAKLITAVSKPSYENIKKEAEEKEGVLYCDGSTTIVIKSTVWDQSFDKT